MDPSKDPVFEGHPKTTIGLLILCIALVFLVVLTEVTLRQVAGLGNPVLFYKHTAFGYRLQPNQETFRFFGAHFKINNLGLRANQDWNSVITDKILFLGDSVTYGGNHLSNTDLFSEVAVKGLRNVQSGNAGMPNWGVENVYGLVVQEKFLPAKTYVSTFVEDDFYRGLTSGDNKPWINYESPRYALKELFSLLWHRYVKNPREINRREREQVPAAVRAEQAVVKLNDMDRYLRSNGYDHLMFISPRRAQVLGQAGKDALVQYLLQKHGVQAVYLLDKINLLGASEDQMKSWYQDDYHLTASGHQVWGGLIHQELRQLDSLQ